MISISGIIMLILLCSVVVVLCWHVRSRAPGYRNKALESIYSIATTSKTCVPNRYLQIASGIASILDVPCVLIGKVVEKGLTFTAQYRKTEAKRGFDHSMAEVVLQRGKTIQCALRETGSKSVSGSSEGWFLGVPVFSNEGVLKAVICVFREKRSPFSPGQVQMVETFASYTANQIESEESVGGATGMLDRKFLGRFTSGIIHEVRNPLNAIWAVSEALFQELGESKAELIIYKEHIKTQVDRLTGLMRELIDFAELSKPFTAQEIDFENLCREAVEFLREMNVGGEINVKIDVKECEGSVVVRGEREKLKRMIVYIIENALQHIPSGSEIVLRLTENVNKMHIIQIIDRGCAILPENIKRVNEPFFSTVKGVGLGLCKVYQIAELHGGNVEIFNNDPPPGVTVQVKLPALLINPAPESCPVANESVNA